ncbi:roadblock/LC7 domain-containing protein [Gordonia aichiensis]
MNNDATMQGRQTLDWVLDGLIDRTPGSEHALVLSADGLPLARSSALTREDAEHLAAMASALHSLARGGEIERRPLDERRTRLRRVP